MISEGSHWSNDAENSTLPSQVYITYIQTENRHFKSS